MKIDDYAGDAVEYEQRVRDDEDRIVGSHAVDRKADRDQKLPDKKPFRDAFRGPFLPLFINLVDKCREQKRGACPSDYLKHKDLSEYRRAAVFAEYSGIPSNC